LRYNSPASQQRKGRESLFNEMTSYRFKDNDAELMALISAPGYRRRRKSRPTVFVLPLAAVVVASGVFLAAAAMPEAVFGPDRDELLLEAGAQLHAALAAAAPAEAQEFAPDVFEAALADAHAELEASGLDWRDARPSALAVICADALRLDRPGHPRPMAIGVLYLSSGGALYAVEFTALRQETTYRVVDLWEWRRETDDGTALAAELSNRYDRFMADAAQLSLARFERAEPVFLRYPAAPSAAQ
jgi:hypothetical protein